MEGNIVDPRRNVSRKDVSCIDDESERNVMIELPWAKTNPHGVKVLVKSTAHLCLDPVRAMIRHIKINFPKHLTKSMVTLPLFSFVDGASFRVLNKATIVNRIRSIVHDSCKEFSGHSFRIGGLLNLLLAGVSFENARLQGRWSESGCWQLYLREHAIVLQQHLRATGPGWNVSSKSDEEVLERAIAKARQIVKDKLSNDGSSKSRSKETKRKGDETVASNKKLS